MILRSFDPFDPFDRLRMSGFRVSGLIEVVL